MKKLYKHNPEDLPAKSSLGVMLGIWKHLNGKRKVQLYAIFMTMLLAGIAEVFTLATVIPFLSALSRPEQLKNYILFNKFTNIFGLTEINDLILLITLTFIFFAILSAFIRLSNVWLTNRISASIGTDLTLKAYKALINLSYEEHLNINSSSVITALVSYSNETMSCINALLQLLCAVLIATFILITIFLLDWKLFLFSFLVFGAAYVLLGLTARRKLISYSDLIAKQSKSQVKYLQESMGAIREILLDNSQDIFTGNYRKIDYSLRKTIAQSKFIQIYPRYSLESVGLVVIAIFSYYLRISSTTPSENFIPLIGAFALAAQRLLPSCQYIYSGWVRIRGTVSQINELINLLDKENSTELKISNFKYNSFEFFKTIELSKVSFKYQSANLFTLQNISFEIRPGEKVGIIGTTGSGKSTLINIIMGLIKPTSGNVLIDSKSIYTERTALKQNWRHSIAHVPQNIYLLDKSIVENIAFGIDPKDINYENVIQCSRIAQIDSFISTLKEGYETVIGERGIRLSGGQKQRIGIARALYKRTKILVLDEATSALDNATETKVMNSLNKLDTKITVITVAHRLSTISKCDKVIELKNGSIKRIVKPIEL